jgi:hypothetical protein
MKNGSRKQERKKRVNEEREIKRPKKQNKISESSIYIQTMKASVEKEERKKTILLFHDLYYFRKNNNYATPKAFRHLKIEKFTDKRGRRKKERKKEERKEGGGGR